MTYRVLYTDNVRADIAAHVRYLQDQQVSSEIIENWFVGLFDLVDSLYLWPLRYPVAEPESRAMGFEVRKAIYGQHLLFYRVDQTQHLVEVLAFRHGARRR
ncbi:MAG TPA: type II toxin-antitoxin system RelE/ParE family toxin [Phycisphaerae bacterium]|mgnify:CR=1 FL=1|jgi:plasmid stabilization system protein ParE|nr:type II toxin-antitoxin system RelE/ParE family toxin [Phycisphaerae bacterium]HOB73523.1 type II toxin-antitoxin system RelE/ParE family toxin [Phycisphaerae bacterium]HOJ54131.1 type II toxin-antitoxin system RelE/ParE family toxin [Phycisphaerae bacterium]HOL25576.1 type II toxin-antitoxin system RelE/ParE family toxin [Phycisphaerae bacterium]HPP20991.1 type II toxin-antitoxin system RelE/ParE family toxin [Phycisphaerae bacterium]